MITTSTGTIEFPPEIAYFTIQVLNASSRSLDAVQLQVYINLDSAPLLFYQTQFSLNPAHFIGSSKFIDPIIPSSNNLQITLMYEEQADPLFYNVPVATITGYGAKNNQLLTIYSTSFVEASLGA